MKKSILLIIPFLIIISLLFAQKKIDKTNLYKGIKTGTELNYIYEEKFGEFKEILGGKGFYKYDFDGNLIEQLFYDSNDKLIQDPFGISKYVFKYDSMGNQIEESHYNSDGSLTESSIGFSKIVRKYNSSGKEVEWTIFDNNGVLNEKGVSKYDSKGNKVELSLHDSIGNLKVGLLGFSVSKYEYDSNDNLIVESYFDSEGNRMEKSLGIHRTTYKYGLNNTQIEERRYDSEGNLTDRVSGISEIVTEYDSNNNMVKWSAFDNETYLKSYMIFKYKKNNLIEKSFYQSGDLVSKDIIQYNNRNLPIEKVTLHYEFKFGEPQEIPNGKTIYEYVEY